MIRGVETERYYKVELDVVDYVKAIDGKEAKKKWERIIQGETMNGGILKLMEVEEVNKKTYLEEKD